MPVTMRVKLKMVEQRRKSQIPKSAQCVICCIEEPRERSPLAERRGAVDGRILRLDWDGVTRRSLRQTARTTRFQGMCPVAWKFNFVELIFKMSFKTYEKAIIPVPKLLTMPVKLASLSRDQEDSSNREGHQLT